MAFVKYPPVTTGEAIAVLKQDTMLLHDIVHGDDTATVLTENGVVPSIDKVIKDLTTRVDSAIQDTGWFIVGTFAAGFTFTSYNQVGRDASGELWSYNGDLPFVVNPLTVPSSPLYTQRGDAALRAELAATNSSVIIGGVDAGSIGKRMNYVTPEMFGTVGLLDNDNTLFLAAIATGKKVIANGASYKLNQIVITTPIDLQFGENTIINNVQTNGVKRPSIVVNGAGLTGAATGVTALGATPLYKSVEVASTTGLSAGMSVMMRETAPLALETNVSAPVMEDFNYYEFFTILSIVGNTVVFEEFVGGDFNLSRSITLQQVQFVDNVNIHGGIHSGGNPTGGGIELNWCRKSNVSAKIKGNSDSDRSGGQAIKLSNCWECEAKILYAQWSLFTARADNIQSCTVDVLGGKRTTNGGLIVNNVRQSSINSSVQDNAGDVSGDNLGVSGRSWGNTFGPITVSGANCYTLWIRQPVTNNIFLPIMSTSGITAAVNLYGSKNHMQLIKVRNHSAPAVALEGDNNVLTVDYEGHGSGVVIRGGVTGNKVNGKSISLDPSSYDVLIGGDITDHEIDMLCGNRGFAYGNGVYDNYSNKIRINGPLPFWLGYSQNGRGWSWTRELSGIGSTPHRLQVIGTSSDVAGLKDLVAESGDTAQIYRITLKTNTAVVDMYSEYIITSRQGGWVIDIIKQGTSSFAPKLTINGQFINLTLNGELGPNTVFMLMEKL